MAARRHLPLLLTLVLTGGCGPSVAPAQVASDIRALTREVPGWVGPSPMGKRLWKIEQAFYEARSYAPAWVDDDRTTPQWKDLVQQLHYAERHGLDPARYGVSQFEGLRAESQTKLSGTKFPLERIPELDAKMTYAYLTYAADLLGWTHRPSDIHRNWLTSPKEDDLAARLDAAVAAGTVRQSLEELAPTHPQYKGLQAALVQGGGLTPQQKTAIRMNLERWRWAPRDLGERYVLINVPAYQLQVMDGDAPALAMRVIVGAPDSQTPLFSDEMTYVVFSPYWNIPAGILREETLPRVARDPDYLRRNHIEVVGTSGEGPLDVSAIDWSNEEATRGLRFRQTPGPENALGLVKFIFPNHFNVYLHDTPGDTLFFRDERDLSHGCIRVENPVGLAEYVLRDQPQWTPARIRVAMNAEREQVVTLKSTLPVHIGYWTAWVEPDGKTVRFTDDPYGIDAKHATLLAK